LVFVFAFGCASARAPSPTEANPGVVFPLHIAEGHGGGDIEHLPMTSPSGSAASSAAPAGSGAPEEVPAAPVVQRKFTSDPPDPTPLRQADQYEYTFRYEKRKVELAGVRPVHFANPIVTPRHVGRFAVELWIGRELIERVRFDFPLLAGEEIETGGRRNLNAPMTLTGGPYTATVLVPAAPRARSARFVDRGLRLEAELSWPPSPAGLGPFTSMDAAPSPSIAPPEHVAPATSTSPSAPPRPAPPPSAAPSSAMSRPAPPSSATPPSAAPAGAPPGAARPR
jgi:hypothetical protein